MTKDEIAKIVSEIYRLIESVYKMQTDVVRYKKMKKLTISQFAKMKLYQMDFDTEMDRL